MSSGKERTKVVLVISALAHGGAERQVLEIARNLDSKSFNVSVVCLSDNNPLLENGTDISNKVVVIRKYHKYDFTVPLRLALFFKKQKADVVHSFLFDAEISSRIAAKLVRVPTILGSERNAQYQMSKGLRWSLYKLTSYLVDAIVANSRAGAETNARIYNLPSHRYRVVYNGVDVERFKPRDRAQARKILGIDEDEVVVGVFASFKRQKNHIYLFEAMQQVLKKVGNVRLILVGDTLDGDFGDTVTYKAEVLEKIKNTGLDACTELLGNRKDVEQIYPACDFTVLPSLNEGTPNVVLESMACGIPAVVTDVSDNAELVSSGKDGIVIPVNDVDIFVENLVFLISNCAERERLGNAARQTALASLSTAAMAENMGAVYSTKFD